MICTNDHRPAHVHVSEGPRRIRHAAETLCESAATWGKKDGDACVQKAVNDAVARVAVPLLTQYYELRSKGDKAGLVQLANAN